MIDDCVIHNNIDYNDYFSNLNVGFQGGAQASLALWKIATGQDNFSKAVDPNFISLTDLHINTSLASAIDGAAIPVGIATELVAELVALLLLLVPLLLPSLSEKSTNSWTSKLIKNCDPSLCRTHFVCDPGAQN